LEDKPRELLVFHNANVTSGYRWKRTKLSLSSSLGVGDTNFRLATLRAPGAALSGADDTGDNVDVEPGMGPEPPAQPQPTAPDLPDPSQPTTSDAATDQLLIACRDVLTPATCDRTVRYYTSSTTLDLTHDPVKDVTVGLQGGHTRAGGLNDESRPFYPEIRGWFAGANAVYTYRLSSRDAFVSNASLVHFWSSNGNRTATLGAQETWQHAFTRRTFGALGAGLNITRFTQRDGLRGFSVFPTFQAAIAHQLSLWRGSLSLTLSSYSSPALDPLRALVDPRLGFGANANYVRKRFSLGVSGTTALSLAPEDHDQGSINSYQADGRVAYRIAELVEVDAGARYSRQQVQDITVLPSSWSAYVGLSFGYAFQLYGKR
jgi:hypothetical protein